MRVLDHVIPPKEIATVRFLVILFGANDSCLKGAPGSQHVPIATYTANLLEIIKSPLVVAQNPRIILVTPPPINEYACEENDRSKGYNVPRRNANHTRLYAEAAREVAKQNSIETLDLHTIFLKHAGQKGGDSLLEGSKQKPPNPFLRMLLHDGTVI